MYACLFLSSSLPPLLPRARARAREREPEKKRKIDGYTSNIGNTLHTSGKGRERDNSTQPTHYIRQGAGERYCGDLPSHQDFTYVRKEGREREKNRHNQDTAYVREKERETERYALSHQDTT